MVEVRTQVPLSRYTTMGIGGNAAEFITAITEQDLISALDFNGPILILGGGSNLLISDSGFAGRVIQIKTSGIQQIQDKIEVAAGENWDEFVDWAIEQGLGLFAPLTGIPGTVGATPIQNVGAYGTEVCDLIDSVKVYDRFTKNTIELKNSDCKFSYRSSLFKRNPTRFVVLSVKFHAIKSDLIPIKYDELATKLGKSVGDLASASEVVSAVRLLRSSKGMILDPKDRDTYSVGSFFLNPRISNSQKAALPEIAPAWELSDGMWKVSAAWLIAQCDFKHGQNHGGAAISGKHLLAICNLGNATFKDVIDLSCEIQTKVKERFQIELQIEPNIVL